MSGSELLSREELVERQARVIAEQAERIAAVQAEVAELKRRLEGTSRNCSPPPAADWPAAAQVRRWRRRGSGGQPGQVVDYVPAAGGGCGADLADAAAAGVVRRQVHDISTITLTVVEHRLPRRRCRCGHLTGAAAPDGGSAPACYRLNLRALAAFLVPHQATFALLRFGPYPG